MNDVLIAALRLKYVSEHYYLSRFVHERTLKRTPFKVTTKSGNTSLIPDGFLEFHKRAPNKLEPSLPLILEHDRGTEQRDHFKRRIQAYTAFLQVEGAEQLFNVSKVTIAFTTFMSWKRVMQMRTWAWEEVQGDPQLASRFIFTELPRHLLFERRWATLTDDQLIALLED